MSNSSDHNTNEQASAKSGNDLSVDIDRLSDQDLQAIAEKIYEMLKQELALERERLGGWRVK